MKLQDQVISLDLAKRMKELGFKQKSLWWWNETPDGATLSNKKLCSYRNVGSAYTVVELINMLPQFIKDNRNYMLTIVKNDNGKWWIGYTDYRGFGIEGTKQIEEITLVNSLVKMLIYLKEKGLLT